jgi:transcriptional regulator with XRE-family HTH domain
MDWKEVIGALMATGLTQKEIAAICNCGQATIADLYSGTTKEPKHALGERLRALHRKMTRRG